MSHVRKDIRYLKSWIEDWNRFCRDVLKVRLDSEQQSIISSVQYNPMTAVASGTARGKDFVAACAAMCLCTSLHVGKMANYPRIQKLL